MVLNFNALVSALVKDAQNHTRMALRKQVTKDVNNIPSGDQDQDEALDDSDNTVKKCEILWKLCAVNTGLGSYIQPSGVQELAYVSPQFSVDRGHFVTGCSRQISGM